MELTWFKVLPIIPYIIMGLLMLGCGIYQLATGRESFWMHGYRRKYNYEACKVKFIRACGVLDVAGGVFIALLIPLLSLYGNLPLMLLLGIPILCGIGIGQHIMLRRYTDNLEKRNR